MGVLGSVRPLGRKLTRFLGIALTDFIRNNCHYFAAGIAYWTLFSLFPLALAGMSISAYFNPSQETQADVIRAIVDVVPISKAALEDLIAEVTEAREPVGAIAIVGLVWSGSAIFSAVRKGINHAWHIERPAYFLVERAIDAVMLAGVVVILVGHLLFITNVFGLGDFADAAGRTPVSNLLLRVAAETLALATTFGSFLLLYRFVPHTTVLWSDVLLGAFVGTIAFEIVRIGLAWFISGFGSLSLIYGSLGAIMAVLVWAYLSALSIMLGAQITYTYTCVAGSRSGTITLPEPGPKTVANVKGPRALITPAKKAGTWLLPPKESDDQERSKDTGRPEAP